MEPKDKMYSEPQDEVKNSVESTESNLEKETQETVDENTTVEAPEKTDEVTNDTKPVELAPEAEKEEIPEAEMPAETVGEEVAETLTGKQDVQDEPGADSEGSEENESIVEPIAEQAETEEPVAEETVAKGPADEELVAEDTETKEKVAEENEAQVKPKESKTEETEKDLSKLSEVELINEFRELLETKKFHEIQQQVDAIKVSFYKQHKANVQQEKKAFVEAGGYEEEFKPEPNPYEKDLKDLLTEFRQFKIQHNKELEAEKDENLRIKYEIIEEIKGLVNREESINKTFQEFKELQQKWREAGLVPQSNMKDLWENYHHHVENFYDYIKINKELRDLDLKKNFEEKINLCEKAEALLLEPSVLKAFNMLQKLHDAWREIGPVTHDKKEELWERFKSATTSINKKHQDFFENRKKLQKKNLDAKTALCEKVEELTALDIQSHKDWEAKSKDIIEIQKYWRTIGFAPKKDNTAIYERFRNLCDAFFDKKREFYSKHKEVQTNNLQLKIDLCVQAEALKDSNDWKKTTDEFIAIQKRWKEIGPVPRKHSDNVWKRFRAACDFFFENKSKFFNTIDETQVDNLKLKNELIEQVKQFALTGDDKADFEKLRDFQRRWTDIGHVPIANKNEVQKNFRDAINAQFDKLRVDDKDRNLLKYRSKVTDMKSSSRGQNKVYAERDKFVSKLKQLESDLITLKNNIGFFSNSKNAESLIKDVERKIANNEEQIEYLKDKIRIIDEAENNEE